MRYSLISIASLVAIACSAIATDCYVWSDTCVDLPICSGSGWTTIGDCTKDYCEDTVECAIMGGTVWTNYIRTREKKRRAVQGGGYEYCKSATYSDVKAGCCTCTGVWYPEDPDT